MVLNFEWTESFWSRSRTVSRKFLIGGLWVYAGGLDTLKIGKTSTDL